MSSEVRVLECVSAVFQKSPKLAESRTQGVFLPVASVLDDINDPLVRITAKVAKIKPLLSPHPFGGRTLKKKRRLPRRNGLRPSLWPVSSPRMLNCASCLCCTFLWLFPNPLQRPALSWPVRGAITQNRKENTAKPAEATDCFKKSTKECLRMLLSILEQTLEACVRRPNVWVTYGGALASSIGMYRVSE